MEKVDRIKSDIERKLLESLKEPKPPKKILGILWSFHFIWYDMWVGFYWSQAHLTLYFAPLPCCVFSLWHDRSEIPFGGKDGE